MRVMRYLGWANALYTGGFSTLNIGKYVQPTTTTLSPLNIKFRCHGPTFIMTFFVGFWAITNLQLICINILSATLYFIVGIVFKGRDVDFPLMKK